jgi:hypothetical protein
LARKVDVAINVCGKPFMTMLALLSLMKHSGRRVNRIFFIHENSRAYGQDYDFDAVAAAAKSINLRGRLEYVVPEYWFHVSPADPDMLAQEGYRLSIRYQYAFERSDKDLLFVMHNDAYFTGDVIGALAEGIEDYAAAGDIGQCWNCPANHSGLCGSGKYLDYRPDLDELRRLYTRVPGRRRMYAMPDFSPEFLEKPWPLPECRVNEWAALINLRRVRRLTAPLGSARPFGAMGFCGGALLDVGAPWFRDMARMGEVCRHVALDRYVRHGCGHEAMSDAQLYRGTEEEARRILERDFGLQAA